MGDLSTAGTTVSTVIFRQDNIFVANVGDSTAVLGECHCFLSLFGWQLAIGTYVSFQVYMVRVCIVKFE